MTTGCPRLRGARGTALFSTAIGVLVFLVFLMFAVQLLFSLYASSVVTAVASDAAHRFAAAPGSSPAAIEAEARHDLGDLGRSASFTWRREDSDGNGVSDTVVLIVVAYPPRFVPRSIGSGAGLTEVRRTIRVREERLG
jgi:hypothetical protein